MSSFSSHILLLLVLSLCSILHLTTSRTAPRHGRSATTIHVINLLRKNSVDVLCNGPTDNDDAHEAALLPGKSLCFPARLRNSTYYCQAVQEREFASWEAFEPKRDRQQAAVYSLVKSDGIYFSHDNSSWEKKATWWTE